MIFLVSLQLLNTLGDRLMVGRVPLAHALGVRVPVPQQNNNKIDMNNIINLCASFILTLIGFVIPILTILLSLFSEGTKALILKYETEKKQSDENISNELKKKESGQELDYKSLEKTLKKLNKNKKVAEEKLGYLKPIKLVAKISLPLIISYVSLLFLFNNLDFGLVILLIFISAITFLLSIYFIWKSLIILVEVTGIINETKRNSEDKIIELLSRLIDKNNEDSMFLKPEKINIKLNKILLTETTNLKYAINVNHSISVSINNSSDLMAKNIEIGFIFPPDFLVERTSNISSIYTEETKQIVRFRQEFVRGNEDNQQGKMEITFLKDGIHDITAFIKGENFRNKYIKFKIEVVN